MIRLLSVAARNLLRNKRRTALAALAIFLGVGAAVFLRGFINGFVVAGLDDAVYGRSGAIQVHRAGYRNVELDSLDYNLPADPAFAAKLRAVPGVKAVTPRIFFEGMLSNGTVSTVFMATAIDPKTEYDVCPTRRTAVASDGKPLDETMSDGVIVGATIASFLDAKTGSTLTASAAARGGVANALDVTVRGKLAAKFIFDSKRVILVPLAFAQSLLKMEDRVSYYALDVTDFKQADAVAERLRAALGPDYAVETWKELELMVKERTERVAYVLGIVIAVLGLLVVAVVLNVMLMTVYERVREVGAMMAVGVRRWQVLVMFLAEAGVLGVVGGVIGAVVAWLAIRGLGVHGIMFTPPGGEPMKVVPFVELGFAQGAILITAAATVLSGALPAWRASRLSPVQALRSN